ncbi:MAG: RDD family protein [Planctomycetia bacterium]|nr:RDD family protein [Planctomycetia bacterium]
MPASFPPPLDTTLRLVSPENIAFEFRLAGPAPRLVAFVIDVLVIMAAGVVLFIPFAVAGAVGTAFLGFFLVAIFFLWWGYGAALETFNNGQTLGKLALGLRTVSQTGLSINVSQAILRNLVRAADIAPPFFPGLVAMACTRRLQRLGDLAAGTVVVYDRRWRPPPPVATDGGINFAADLVPPGFRPDPVLATALAEYAARRPMLSSSRRQELASIPAARLCAAWGIPSVVDPDALILAVHERTLTGGPE